MAVLPAKPYNLGTYSQMYTNPGYNITQIPVAYDTIYLFQCDPTGDGGYTMGTYINNIGPSSGAASAAAACATVQGRGQRVVLDIGGAGAGFNFTTQAHRNNCVASVKSMITQLGGNVSALSFNTFETGFRAGDPAIYVQICQDLLTFYGSNFSIHADPAAGTYQSGGGANLFDRDLMQAMAAANVLTYCTQQYYDDSSLWDPNYIKFDGAAGLSEWIDVMRRNSRGGPIVRTVAQACALIGQSLGSGNYAGGGPLDGPSGSIAVMRRNLTNRPTLRGFVSWSGQDDFATTAQVQSAGPHARWDFGTRYRSLITEFEGGITPTPVPVMDFTYTPTSGNVPVSISVTATATNSPTGWSWTTSDGATSTLQNPTFTFTTPGTKSITGTASNAGGNSAAVTKSFVLTGTVPPEAVVTLAAPIFDKTVYSVGETLNMTGTITVTGSSYTTTQLILTLRQPGATDAGGPYTDILILPAQVLPLGNSTYTATYTFPVGALLGQWYGYQTYQKPSDSSYVLGPKSYFTLQASPVIPAPVSNFTYTPTSGNAPLAVTCTDTSTGTPTSWTWTTSDGQSSAVQNPVFNFVTPGGKTITLVATNAGGSSAPITKNVNVTVTPSIPPTDPSSGGWLAYRKRSIDIEDIERRRRDGDR